MHRALRLALAAIASVTIVLGVCATTVMAQDDSRPTALKRIAPEQAVLVLVDFTDGLYPIVETIDADTMLNNAVATAKIAKTFDIPIMVLGDEGGFYGTMHPAVKSFAGDGQPFSRTTPSAWRSGGLKQAVETSGRRQVLIGGITTDNCTFLTSLDMLNDGYDVYVIADISGADSRLAEQAALMRLRDAGAATVSWVMLGSELLGDWQTPEGKALMRIYGRHINGPHSSPQGSSVNDPTVGQK